MAATRKAVTSSSDFAVDTPPMRDWVTFWAGERVSRLSSTSLLSAMSLFFSHQMTQRAIVPVMTATTTRAMMAYTMRPARNLKAMVMSTERPRAVTPI